MKNFTESIFDDDQTYINKSGVLDLLDIRSKDDILKWCKQNDLLFTPQQLKKLTYETIGRFQSDKLFTWYHTQRGTWKLRYKIYGENQNDETTCLSIDKEDTYISLDYFTEANGRDYTKYCPTYSKWYKNLVKVMKQYNFKESDYMPSTYMIDLQNK